MPKSGEAMSSLRVRALRILEGMQGVMPNQGAKRPMDS